ncbi:hypothetical protein STIAU_1845 [Stigmatella aurantiaca DW4/3-1]|uniref:Uncharacterized protein n=2 Tax=Stigmatella aurantiaca (strain DW4/3-1) TaxID=378806 RepID=Q08SK1_STIAD|nr:hypothetical protein STIAU_1845 [Stigmatella aurantiaca DW4/3-1]
MRAVGGDGEGPGAEDRPAAAGVRRLQAPRLHPHGQAHRQVGPALRIPEGSPRARDSRSPALRVSTGGLGARALGVEGLDEGGVLLLHRLAAHLEGGRHLPGFDGEVFREDGDALDGLEAGQLRVHLPRHGLLQVLVQARLGRQRPGLLWPALLLGQGARRLRVQRQQRHQVLAPLADDDRVGDRGHRLEQGLDVRRRGLLAARGDDDLLLPAGDVGEALRVQDAHIPGVQPPVLQQLRGGLVILVVAHAHVAPPDEQLAVLGDPHLHAHQGAPHGAQLGGLAGVEGGGPRQLGRAVDLAHDEIDGREEIEHLPANGGRRRDEELGLVQANARMEGGEHRAAGQPVLGLQPRRHPLSLEHPGVVLGRRPPGPRQHALAHRGQGAHPLLRLGLELLPDPGNPEEEGGPDLPEIARHRIDGVREVHLGARHQRPMQGEHLLGDVRERQVGQDAGRLHLEVRLLKDRRRRPHQVAVAEHHPLGRPRGSRSVNEGGQGLRREGLDRVPVRPLVHPHAAPQDVLIAQHALRQPLRGLHDNEVTQAGQPLAQHQGGLQKRLVFHQEDFRLTVAEDVLQLFHAAVGVEPDGNASERHGGQVRHQPLLPVEAEDAQRPPGGEAQPPQAECEAPHPQGVIMPGGGPVRAAVAAPEGGTVLVPGRLLVEHVDHRLGGFHGRERLQKPRQGDHETQGLCVSTVDRRLEGYVFRATIMSIDFTCQKCEASFELDAQDLIEGTEKLVCPHCDAKAPANLSEDFVAALSEMRAQIAVLGKKFAVSMTLESEDLEDELEDEDEDDETDEDDDLDEDDDEDEDEDVEDDEDYDDEEEDR